MEWISVKDEPPKKGGRYFVYEEKAPHAHNCAAYDYPHPCCCKPNVAYYNVYGNQWRWSSFEDSCTPTHWMPLPEVPNAGS